MPKSKEQWLEQRESARIAMRGFYGPMKVAKGRYLELRDLWETQWRLFDAAERKLKPVTKVKAQGAAKENPAKRISRRFSKFFDGMDKDNQKKLFDLMKGQTNGASKAEQEDT